MICIKKNYCCKKGLARRSGFSLTELAIVATVIIILSVFAIINYLSVVKESRIARTRADLRRISQACVLFHGKHRQWPKTVQELTTIMSTQPDIYAPPKLRRSEEIRSGTYSVTTIPSLSDKFPFLDAWRNMYLIDPYLCRAVSKGPDGVLQIPFGGSDPANCLGLGIPAVDASNWPGVSYSEPHDDIYEHFLEKNIYFTSDRIASPDAELYSMSLSGENQKKIKSNVPGTDCTFPCPSPDGMKLAYISDEDGNTELYLFNRGTGKDIQYTVTTPPVDNGSPSFSPDGDYILFHSDRNGDYDLFRMRSDGTGLKCLFSGLNSNEMDPVYSPDGRKIIFTSDKDGDEEIFHISADGRNLTQLTYNAFSDLLPVFSPDGSRIAYVSDLSGTPDIFMMDSNGNNQTQLTSSAGIDSAPWFVQDGRKLLFHSDRDGTYDIFMMNLDGTNQSNLSRGATALPAPYNNMYPRLHH